MSDAPLRKRVRPEAEPPLEAAPKPPEQEAKKDTPKPQGWTFRLGVAPGKGLGMGTMVSPSGDQIEMTYDPRTGVAVVSPTIATLNHEIIERLADALRKKTWR